MTSQEMQERTESLKNTLLAIDCQIDALKIKRWNVEKAIQYMEQDLVERWFDNATADKDA